MKTKEELNALKEEVATLNKKLRELTEDELKLVMDGVVSISPKPVKAVAAKDNFEGWETINIDNSLKPPQSEGMYRLPNLIVTNEENWKIDITEIVDVKY